jgi:AcrR family transcriptional regulator
LGSTGSTENDSHRPNRYERRRMETRNRLIKAGLAVVSEKGIEASTVQDITEAADVGRGSFYNFFDTKEELVQAIIDDHVELLLKMQRCVIERFDEPAMALAALLRYSFDIELENLVVARFTVQTQKVGGAFFQKFHDGTFKLVQAGRESGVFPVVDAELGVVALASLMLGALEAILIERVRRDCTLDIVGCILRLLGAPEPLIKKTLATELPSLEELCS